MKTIYRLFLQEITQKAAIDLDFCVKIASDLQKVTKKSDEIEINAGCTVVYRGSTDLSALLGAAAVFDLFA